MSVIIVNVTNMFLTHVKNLMKSYFNTLLYILLIFSFENSAYSLSDNQIKQICQNKPRKLDCIKNLKLKNLDLIEGNRIEIQVVPFKK